MRLENLNNAAFTLIEILLASIIFLISVAGLFATLTAVRAPVINKESALSAAVFGKQVLGALYSNVDASTYYTNICASPCSSFDLSVGIHQVPQATLLGAGITWPLNLKSSNTACDVSPNACLVYTVTCSDGNPPIGADCKNANNPTISIARQVDLNIKWPTV